MEAEGRLLHRDWSLYDTAHVVFRPRHMTPEELAEGYAWCYERLFSHALDLAAAARATGGRCPPYLAMSYLYKRSNRLWHLLIRHRLIAAVWRPLVELTRRQRFRSARRLEALGEFMLDGAPQELAAPAVTRAAKNIAAVRKSSV